MYRRVQQTLNIDIETFTKDNINVEICIERKNGTESREEENERREKKRGKLTIQTILFAMKNGH